jgi:hypothetical protein
MHRNLVRSASRHKQEAHPYNLSNAPPNNLLTLTLTDTNRKRIAAKGGLEAITIAMDAHSEDGNVQEW